MSLPRPTEQYADLFAGWTTDDFLIACLARLTKIDARLAGIDREKIDATGLDSQALRVELRTFADNIIAQRAQRGG